MARPDENPIRAPRILSKDFQNAADPAREPRKVDKPELEYRPPEPLAPSIGGGDRPQSDKPRSKSKPVQTSVRASSNANSVDLSQTADQAKSMIRQAFNRNTMDKDSDLER